MKVCGVCNIKKPDSEFYRNKTKSDGLQSKCKTCSAAYVRKHYQDNKNYYVTKARRNRDAQIDVNREALLQYLSSHPCVDCGEANPVVLEFDHVRGKKKDAVSALAYVGYSLARVMAEVEKCDVRCANCHRIRTAKQFGWFNGSHRDAGVQ